MACDFRVGMTYLNLASNFIHWPLKECHVHDLPHLRSLDHLVLAQKRLGDRFVAALVDELPRCPALAVLDLENTYLSDADVQALPQVLPHCPRLARLILTGGFNRLSAPAMLMIQQAWADTRGPGNTGTELPRVSGLSMNAVCG